MFKFFLATTALFAAAVIGSAQPGPPRQSPIIAAIDTDHDGTVSAAELAAAGRSLASLDANKDGQLTDEEVRPQFGFRGGDRRGQRRGEGPEGARTGGGGAGPEDMVKMLMGFDANHDGQLSKSEVPERMQGLFIRGDKNNDGVLSADEIKALAASQPGRPQGPGGDGPMDPVRAALDANHDGVISAAEMSLAPSALAKLDRNGDGILTADEVRPMRGGPGGRGFNPDEMYRRLLAENDANNDGKLAVSELPERMRQFMGNADTNKDGFISKEEMMAVRPGGGQRPQGGFGEGRRREE